MIPLILRIKKENHRNIARAQDIIMETLYEIFNDAVLHGGTGIWRCYQGNRFSEDIDVYIKKDQNKINLLFNTFEKKGFIIKKKKISDKSIYSNLQFERTQVRFEALFMKSKNILKEYETIESNFLTVYTLTPEDFLFEKINTYIKRKKIRDLYDIFFLLRLTKPSNNLNEKLKGFIKNYEKPIDEKDLKTIIISGLVPNSEKMVQYIKGRIR